MEGDWLHDMHLFVAVGHTRNFGRAATALGIPASTLSRRISELEKSLGLRLLNRSTRKVELTEDGEIYLSRAERIVEAALLAHEDLREQKTRPRGNLRISMPHRLADHLIRTWLMDFARLYPDLTFEIDTEPTHIDLIADRFDVAILGGPLPDSQLYVRRVNQFPQGLFASPGYLAERGAPTHPSELAAHDCIRTTRANLPWNFSRDGERVEVEIHGRFAGDILQLAEPLALAGFGIAQLILPSVSDATLATGRLVRLLADWQPDEIALSILTPSRLMPARSRLLVDFLVEKLRGR